jgi:hypothetical protein
MELPMMGLPTRGAKTALARKRRHLATDEIIHKAEALMLKSFITIVASILSLKRLDAGR